jgi:two-component system sensor histidine kinase UhpB
MFPSASGLVPEGAEVRAYADWKSGGKLVKLAATGDATMRSLSLRARLTVLLGALLFLCLIANIAFIAWNAGPRVRAESESDARLSRELIETALASLQETPDPRPPLRRLLSDLQTLRHVRIFVTANEAEAQSMPIVTYADPNGPPLWFVRLFEPQPSLTIVPATIRGRNFGDIVIAADPTNEVAEIWAEIGSIVMTAFTFVVCLFVVIILLVGRALKPLTDVGHAITCLAAGDTGVKLVPRGPPEFIDISEKLNGLALNLGRVNAENTRLVQQMMKVQEEERAQIARDLHDEMGPHLFCIRANVSALGESETIPSKAAQTVVAIGEQAEAIQTLLRRLLQRLRPAGLGELGLGEALRTLVGSWRAAHPEIEISLEASDDFACIDENVSLAIYRVVQEGLTNVFRHAGASNARVRVEWIGPDSETETKTGLRVRVEDDGVGVPERFERGLGLTGMYERVRACGGYLSITPRPGRGTRIEAILPLAPADAPVLESA